MDNYLNQVIGDRYEIQEIIGIGGMSVVYKAYDRLDDRTVAVKILKDEYLANEEFRLRFKNESKAIAVLSHPNIVKVYDVSFGDRLQYIVMEYVEGITLKEYIERQKQLEWKEALHFTVQILRALQHAHDKGIIHRDIKPQNIMLLPNATIKVADFGIARFSRSETRNLYETAAIGSVHYISPEQAKGENTDGRADIYSVGVVLYEMITGKLPFESENDISVAIMHMQEEAIKPSAINPSIPEGLEQIVLRAMQKNPADRYQSAAEFLFDLDEFKRNPQIKFDYSYFIDQKPTKYLDTSSVTEAASKIPVKINEDEEKAASVNEEDDDSVDETEEEDSGRNITIPVLIGIAVTLVAVVAVIIGIAFAGQFKNIGSDDKKSQSESSETFFEKLDVFGWFTHNKVEIPNFINMDFDEALEKYPDLAIDKTPQLVYNTTYEAGKICEQFPAAGKKVSKDTVIKLTVATNSEMVLIKDVTGMNYLDAETLLCSSGINVELIPKSDENTPQDNVIYTDPSVNTYIEYQGTVYVYYSATSEQAEPIRVPNVVGDELEIAKKKINAAGLNVGAVKYDSSSASLEGYVIGQTPSGSVIASVNDYVNLVVGNGVPATSTATLSIFLPEGKKGETGDLKSYLNNNVNDIITGIELDGKAYTVNFTGSGENNTFKIYIGSTLIYSGKIDFTKDPPQIEISSYAYSTKEDLPDVVGKSLKDAEKELKSAGFNNINVLYEESKEVAKDSVISQSPVSSSLTKYQTTTVITLTVSLGSSEPETEVTDVVTEPSSAAPEPSVTEETTALEEVGE